MLDGIDTSTLTGLRDRALIGIMLYTFARIGAVPEMNVRDDFSQGLRSWVRFHGKGHTFKPRAELPESFIA